MNEPKFKFIVDSLAPKADLSERRNKARVSSLRLMAGLPKDISVERFDRNLDHEVKKANSSSINPASFLGK